MLRRLLILACVWALLAPATIHAGSSAPYLVVVNEKNPVKSLSRGQVASMFLKKTTSWDAGGQIAPVDQSEDNSARRAFSDDVLKRSVSAVKSYWQQRIFSGRDVPPPEKASDEEVVSFVKSKEHAIGYVSGSADLSGVRVVTLTD